MHRRRQTPCDNALFLPSATVDSMLLTELVTVSPRAGCDNRDRKARMWTQYARHTSALNEQTIVTGARSGEGNTRPKLGGSPLLESLDGLERDRSHSTLRVHAVRCITNREHAEHAWAPIGQKMEIQKKERTKHSLPQARSSRVTRDSCP